MNAFFIGLQFLTRISIVKQTVWTEEDFGKSVKFFPLVGAVLGIAYVLFMMLLSLMIVKDTSSVLFLVTTTKFPMLKAAVAVTLMVILTGGIHCDGFMDTMDGLFSGRSRERILEIMKDSRVGAFGVVSFIMVTLIEFASLAELSASAPVIMILALFVTPIIGRMMMVVAIGFFPYARPEGIGKAFAQYTTKATILFASIETLILLSPLFIFLLDILQLILFIVTVTLIFTFYFGWYANYKLGGLTGDVYGAIATLSETLVFALFVIIS